MDQVSAVLVSGQELSYCRAHEACRCGAVMAPPVSSSPSFRTGGVQPTASGTNARCGFL
jgi:hypothetical protein